MLLTRWEPMAELSSLRDQFNRVFERLGETTWGFGGGYPALNVWEDNENLRAEAELPGFTAEDLNITVAGNELTIKGSRKSREDENVSYHRRERGHVEFTRTMTLPCEIAADKVEAHMKDGVLSLVLPKAPNAKARKIDVRAN